MTRHFLDVDDLEPAELVQVLDLAELPDPPPLLAGRGVALLFDKPSLRTRVAMEMAVVQLGGHPISLRDAEIGVDSREPAHDIARVLSGFCGAIAARVHSHDLLERLAGAATVPVINLLSDDTHPCQALADVLTLRQHFGRLDGLRVAYVGDGNNVCRALMKATTMLGMSMAVATPPGYEPPPLAGTEIGNDPMVAVAGADAVYTDVWTSMGQESESKLRRAAFAGFTVDAALMAACSPHAVFLHCLPAHRGEEVAAEVIDGPQSVVFQQAANRAHAHRGLLMWLYGARP